MVTPTRRPKCPTCQRPFDPEDADTVMPFCSRRCQEMDLGRWLGESYGLPLEPEQEEDLGAE